MRIMRINGWLYERDARTSQEGRDARTSQAWLQRAKDLFEIL